MGHPAFVAGGARSAFSPGLKSLRENYSLQLESRRDVYSQLELSTRANLVLCTGSPWIVCNRCSQRESCWPWMIANSIHVWSSSPRTDILGYSQPSLRD